MPMFTTVCLVDSEGLVSRRAQSASLLIPRVSFTARLGGWAARAGISLREAPGAPFNYDVYGSFHLGWSITHAFVAQCLVAKPGGMEHVRITRVICTDVTAYTRFLQFMHEHHLVADPLVESTLRGPEIILDPGHGGRRASGGKN